MVESHVLLITAAAIVAIIATCILARLLRGLVRRSILGARCRDD